MDITRDQFFSWNPALAGNCDGLLSGYYYCVANFDASDLPPPPTVTASPSPTASGTVSECDSWYLAVTGDNCTIIAESFGTFSESSEPFDLLIKLCAILTHSRLHILEP